MSSVRYRDTHQTVSSNLEGLQISTGSGDSTVRHAHLGIVVLGNDLSAQLRTCVIRHHGRRARPGPCPRSTNVEPLVHVHLTSVNPLVYIQLALREALCADVKR